MKLPDMHAVTQSFDATGETDPVAAVRRAVSRDEWFARTVSGQSVAVAVGSRGIPGIAAMVAALVEELRRRGLDPFIVPAMGSHGGATPEGQRNVLDRLGVTEASVRAPIRAGMEVVSLGRLPSVADVLMARDVMDADHLVLINRVKPHTAFRGDVESGLCKMLVVGCGKDRGALTVHKYGLAGTIVPAARTILNRVSVLFGIALLENAREGIASVHCVSPDDFVQSDAELLKAAFRLLPRIPLDDLDILVVDEMGKNISGAGMDPNVIGMWRREGGARRPDYRTVIVLGLTPQTGGNALGIGLADLTTRRVLDQVDLQATYTNVLTTGIWASGRLPIALEHDRAVLETALMRAPDPERVRVVRIVNTLHLGTFWASTSLLPELDILPGVTVDPEPLRWEFDQENRLKPFDLRE